MVGLKGLGKFWCKTNFFGSEISSVKSVPTVKQDSSFRTFKNRSSKSTFNISDFRTEAKNIVIEFDSYNEIPTLEKASFEISLKNLEVNFPKDVQDDREFKKIADYLNINSGKFRIRQIDLDLTFNRGRDLKLKGSVDTQFGKAVIDGSFSIRQPVRYDSDLTIDKFTIVISNLT